MFLKSFIRALPSFRYETYHQLNKFFPCVPPSGVVLCCGEGDLFRGLETKSRFEVRIACEWKK